MSLPLIPLGLLGQGGTMGYPVIRATGTDFYNTFDTPHSIDLPTNQAGDLILVHVSAAGFTALNTISISLPSGWTSLGYWTELSALKSRVICIEAPSPIASVLFATGEASFYSATCYVFSEYSKTPTMTPFPSSSITASPNSPQITVPPDWGGAPHCTFISSVYKGGSFSISADPSGYGDRVHVENVFSARKNAIAVSDDPGAWATSASTLSLPITIAVRGPE